MTNANDRSGRVAWHAFNDEGAWAGAAVGAIAGALRGELAVHARTWLLLSGGTTPAPVYRALAQAAIDWSRVVVSLVDDRDVEPDAEGSNARLIGETLLRDRAVACTFIPLRMAGQTLEQAVATANAAWPFGAGDTPAGAAPSLALAVLGMGDDGHTASLFPDAKNLDAALASRDAYAAIDAHGCPVAGAWSRRISLTPAGLARTQRRMLLLRGSEKREVFQRALASGDMREMPIRIAIDLPGAPLEVFCCV
jgi:6-phosphogluconolactonase